MGYGDRHAGETGRIGEAEADSFLMQHGFVAMRPPGRDTGIDRLITSSEWPDVRVTAQVKGRRQMANPRWFQLSITPSQIRDATKCGQSLDSLWQHKIMMVDFWIMVSLPMNEVWVIPSRRVMDIAHLNSQYYRTRRDNQYDKPHLDERGNHAKRQKELNLDVLVDSVPLWHGLVEYRNQVAALRQIFAERARETKR
jgi:hypothetical protein